VIVVALDGNAIAGTLVDVFGAEMTIASCVCAGCGARFLMAESEVYQRAPGTVVRCRSCPRDPHGARHDS
jgi:class 3 adenylate cyclase